MDIEVEAAEEAVRRVSALFQSKEALPRVGQYKLQFKQKQSLIENKVAHLVQTQLGEAAFALNSLEQSRQRLSDIDESFSEIVSLAGQVKHLLNDRDYPSIQAIRNARHNMDTTIRLLNIFRDIPVTIGALQDGIQDSSISVKTAYLEMRRLYKVREQAAAHSGQYSKKLLELLERQFKEVRMFAEILEKHLFQLIERTIELAGDDPATLVDAVQVIEMEDRSPKFKVFEYHKVQSSETMREKCLRSLETAAATFFQEAFDNADDTKKEESADKALQSIIAVGRRLEKEMDFIIEFVSPCFPPGYNVNALFEARLTKWLYSRLMHVSADFKKLSTPSILEGIKWIGEFCLGFSDRNSSIANEFLEYSELLLDAYLDREQIKIKEWFNKILQNDWTKDWQANPVIIDGIIMTSAPQDLFSTLNRQIEVAQLRLTGEAFVRCVTMICKVLRDFQYEQEAAMKARGPEKEEAFICAMINNSHYCQE